MVLQEGIAEVREQITRARQQIKDAAIGLVNARVLSPSLHGNMSARLPGTEWIVFTAASSLANVTDEGLAVLDLSGKVIEGEVHPASAEVIRMHTEVYRKRDNIGGIVHTHSPFATSFAVANKEIALVSEALVRFGVVEAIPVAAYAPRGSEESVSNILDVIGPQTKACLLQNHGLLTFTEDITTAQHLVLVIEEAAQAAINAASLGGATVIAEEMHDYTRQRAQDFAARGNLTSRSS